MYRSSIIRISRWVGRNDRSEAEASYVMPEPNAVGGRHPAAGWFRQRLQRVPWRHVWIAALVVLLLLFALFGFFPRH